MEDISVSNRIYTQAFTHTKHATITRLQWGHLIFISIICVAQWTQQITTLPLLGKNR